MLPDILINFKKRRNIAYLSILYKMLHNIDHQLYFKLPQFAKKLRITRQIAEQNDGAFVGQAISLISSLGVLPILPLNSGISYLSC